jgi:diguanylate cyclase (GGDEF)-like protein
MVLISAIFIVLAALVVYGGVSYLLRPLTDVALRLHAMARGDVPVDFLSQQRHDEIGLIATGFNSLLTRLRESEAAMTHMAHHDALTGLPNLQLFRDRLTQALHYAQRHDGGLTLLYLDLDGFKPINDNYGHPAGDAVLREVAQRILGILRKSDTVARLGGDEFAVILSDSGDNAELVAEKCRAAIRRPMQFEGHEIAVNVSIGIAYFPIDGTNEEELRKKADAAMYRAKRLAKEDAGEACKSAASPL